MEKQHLSTVEGKDLENLCLDMELPMFGYLTRYEWLWFIMVHAQRHIKQIEDIQKRISQKK